MKIVIDARWIFPRISGIGTYTLELIREMTHLDRSNEFILLFQDAELQDRISRELDLSQAPNFRTTLVPHRLFTPGDQLRLPGFLRRTQADVYHSTNYLIPLLAFPRNRTGRTRCIATIHDVIPLALPNHAPKARKSRILPVFRWLLVQIGARADTIITVSQASRRDIITHLRIPPGAEHKVKVVYNGVSPLFRPPAAPRPRGPAIGDAPRKLLYVGRLDPYKNVTGLVRIFAAVRAQAGFPVQLVIAGAPDPRYPEAEQLARQLGVHGDIVWTGYLPPDRLAGVYQGADCLVHPSRYEGFGLQIAEAMACNLPVVSSRAASLPEVAGDAALLLDPDDVDGFAAQALRVLTDATLAGSLAARGLLQAARFSWKTAARETLALYAAAQTGQQEA